MKATKTEAQRIQRRIDKAARRLRRPERGNAAHEMAVVARLSQRMNELPVTETVIPAEEVCHD
jgi:hypothetical protein